MIVSIEQLYVFADDHGYEVDWVLFENIECMSARLSDGTYLIAINPAKLKGTADHKTKLAHDIGHCETGSFYNEYSPFDVVQQHEHRADKWAILHLVPKKDLDAAVADGHTEVWELAEIFEVTEEFMRKAIVWYKYGTLDTRPYFAA